MGYWGVSASSSSLFTALIEDTELLWGDSPADALDKGMDKLIRRLTGELGRVPTVAEVDAVKTTAPEMVEAIARAKKVFAEDIGREMLDVELDAGLRFCDTEISIDESARRDISIGDVIRWAVMRKNGFYSEIDYIAQGVVTGLEYRECEYLNGTRYQRKFWVVVTDNFDTVDVRPEYASKVLPGDKSVEAENADREARQDYS